MGRDRVGRLMRELGLAGARRAKSTRTTTPAPTPELPADRVRRALRAPEPNRLWVTDLS